MQADVTCCDHAVFHNRDICCLLQILLQYAWARKISQESQWQSLRQSAGERVCVPSMFSEFVPGVQDVKPKPPSVRGLYEA